ncbi:putative permease [Escherichia coli]|nr:putative permease [Escherichia coli]
MTLGKLYTESEITVMHACGLSKAVLVKAAMILAVFTAIVAAVNVMWRDRGHRVIRMKC